MVSKNCPITGEHAGQTILQQVLAGCFYFRKSEQLSRLKILNKTKAKLKILTLPRPGVNQINSLRDRH